MWVYIVTIVLPILIQHIKFETIPPKINRYNKKNSNSMILFWGLLLFFLVLRNKSVGIDLSTYEYIFELNVNGDWAYVLSRSEEIGWNVLNKLISQFGGGFRTVIVISAICSTFWISKAYVKYSPDTSLTIALFIVMSNFVLLFSGLKQSIAISLGFLAFEYTRDKKIIPFLITTFVAILFHTSAFMIFFMYPLYHFRIKKKWCFAMIGIFGLVWIYNKQIFTFLGGILNRFTNYDTAISQTGSVTMLILFIAFAAFSFIIPNEAELDNDTTGMRNFMLLSVAIQMFAPLHTLAMRMNYYYIAFIPLLIPRIVRCRSTRLSQVAKFSRFVMIIFFIIYFFATAPKDNVLHIFPYSFFWD